MIFRSEPLNGRTGHEAGRALLRQLHDGEIAVTKRGKPYFVNGPHFSISHTKDHVFCCLSRENVGIDAEEIGRQIEPAIGKRFCSVSEQQRIRSNDDLLRLWVLKESYAKFTGRGLGDYLRQTDFFPEDPRIQIIDGCYVAVFTEERN